MIEPIYNYDVESDSLFISFASGEQGTGIELTDHIILRINIRDRRAIGVILLDYSIIAQLTDLGPRSFPITEFERMPTNIREIVLDILRQSPVRDILTLSAYTPNLIETTPIIVVQPIALATEIF